MISLKYRQLFEGEIMPPSKKTSDLPNQVLLKNAAIKLFAKYGYMGTTVRMIAEKAELSPGQVNVHFGTKEQLYLSIIEDITSATSKYFDPILEDIERLKKEGDLNKETAHKYIERVIDLQIDFALNPDNQDKLLLVCMSMAKSFVYAIKSDIAAILVQKIEHVLAVLITAYSGKPGYLRARTISRALNGAIVSFGEHGELLMNSAWNGKFAPKSAEWMRQYLKEFIMASIDAAEKIEMH
jgi:AcrR family transcriptional regulator